MNEVLRRKRVEQAWLQRQRGDPRTPEALDSLWWQFFKVGILDLAGLRAYRLSSEFYQRKMNRRKP